MPDKPQNVQGRPDEQQEDISKEDVAEATVEGLREDAEAEPKE